MLAITADTGAFFSIILKAIRARKILEIGTSSGFSTLWFADAIMSGTRKVKPVPSIITIEGMHEKAVWAADNFKRAGVEKMITIIEGEARETLRRIRMSDQAFDFVFIDADKEHVIEYFDLALPMVRIGGIIAADNMLYPEHFRQDMAKYARHVRRKRNVQSVTVPIGMGEEITIRLA